MRKIIVLISIAACVISCNRGISSASSQLSNDEYDRLYMANKEYLKCDLDNDGVISVDDVEVISINSVKAACSKILDSRGGEPISKQEYIDSYDVPKILISGERLANVVYKSVGDERVLMDIYLPEEKNRPEGLMPVAIFYHGGGWRNGDKYMIHTNGCLPVVEMLLKSGVAVVSPNYRFIIDGEQFLSTVISDSKDVLAYLNRDGAKYGIDGNRIVVWGGSAGGHLALMNGVTAPDTFPGDEELKSWRTRPLGVVSWYGAAVRNVDRFDVPVEAGQAPSYIGFSASTDREEVRAALVEASPYHQISSYALPTYLFIGEIDNVTDTQAMYDKFQECGVKSDILVVKGAGHGWAGDTSTFEPGIDEVKRATYVAVMDLLDMPCE